MHSATVKRLDGQQLVLSGELTFRTVVTVRDGLESELRDVSGQQYISLAGVTQADSSALSLWLCLQRWARCQNIELQVVDIPDDIRALGRLVGMDSRWANAGFEDACLKV